jgi:TolB protein
MGPSPLLARGKVEPASAIPWGQVGPGWLIGTYTSTATAHVYLVDPIGGRYAITSWPAPEGWRLLAWSGDHTRLLLSPWYGTTPNVMREVSLRTGHVRDITLPKNTTVFGYTQPTGLNLLAVTRTGDPNATPTHVVDSLVRLDTNGHVQLVLARRTYPNTLDGAEVLSAPDGQTLVITGPSESAQRAQLQLIRNDGTLVRVLATRSAGPCTAVKWWTPTVVLATCHATPIQRLWLLPISGAAPTPLTAVRDGRGPDLGDINAWQLPHGVYLNAFGACGGLIIAKEDTSGTAQEVTAPGLRARNQILAVTGGRMLVSATSEGNGGCSAAPTYVWFDPAQGRTTPFLPGTVDGGAKLNDLLLW